jgi:diacylglycerol kinase (ATP)
VKQQGGGQGAGQGAWGDGESKGQARKISRSRAKLARLTARVERDEERRAQEIKEALGRSEVLEPVHAAEDDRPAVSPADAAGGAVGRMRWGRALLIINTKSGPKADSISRVRDVVALLAAQGIETEVRVKLRKKQARREAKRAARAGFPLVVAAGGDGTVEAVAGGLVGTKTVLGILPLGTYNNVATCLGIPSDLAEACALIGLGPTRTIDVGCAEARNVKGRKRSRYFLEMAAVGVTASLMPLGQNAKRGKWGGAAGILPKAMGLRPVPAVISLDKGRTERQVNTLLVEVANAPRMGPGLPRAPEARLDDGLLDVSIYQDTGQARLAAQLARWGTIKSGEREAQARAEDERVERLRAQRVRVRSAPPLPVLADSKVLGTTPARFTILPAALRVVVGRGSGLTQGLAEPLVEAALASVAAQEDGNHAGLLVEHGDARVRTAGPGRKGAVLPAAPLGGALAALTAFLLLRVLARRQH